MTIVEFLLARITEDEAAAHEATTGPWTAYGDGVVLGATENPEVCRMVKTWNLEHIARHDPARVLAECEAKRRIVDMHPTSREMVQLQGRPESEAADICAWCRERTPCLTLRVLAAVYADHPDYDLEWAL